MNDAPTRDARGHTLARITNEIVHEVATHYGKGPTRAYSSLSGDVLTCVMRDGLTTAERTLVRAGRCGEVRALRRGFQDVMHDRYVAIVEGATSLEVDVHLSQVNLSPEVDVEIFLLRPAPAMPAA